MTKLLINEYYIEQVLPSPSTYFGGGADVHDLVLFSFINFLMHLLW